MQVELDTARVIVLQTLHLCPTRDTLELVRKIALVLHANMIRFYHYPDFSLT